MAFTMKFGKFKGKALSDPAIPDDYLTYLLTMDNLYPETKAEIEKEQARRRGGDGPETGHGRPAAAPASKNAPGCVCAGLRVALQRLLGIAEGDVPF